MNGSPLLLDRAELDDRSEFRDAVLAGLDSKPRAIPAKFLYDAQKGFWAHHNKLMNDIV